MIDKDQSGAKKAAVRHDISRAINYEPLTQEIPIAEWVKDRQGRDVLWAHFHRGTTLSAIWTTITLIWVTILFWKSWAKATWVEYFALLFRGAPSFIRLMFKDFRPSGL
ncbi:MAG: hypothetical protein KJO81_01595 [Gammaproteobacteria bacterium]|nr:hypothetical protein [Gammaproteobacteria bacterium]